MSPVSVASSTDDDEAGDPLETLRERYAAGELDEVGFERKVERLLETEDIEVPEGATATFDQEQPASAAERADHQRDLDRE